MKVFKIVHIRGDGILESISGSNDLGPYTLTYATNVKTIPKIGELFCVTTHEAAKTFAARFTYPDLGRAILYGSAETTHNPNERILVARLDMSPESSVKRIEDFWNHTINGLYQLLAPAGTILCHSFTPERILVL